MNYDVTVIGEIYQDHVFSGFRSWPSPGEEIFTDAYEWELGGGAVTTACALARLGRSVQIIGVVGQDNFSRIAERLEQFGVGADSIASSSVRSGVSVSISTVEDRTFFTFRGANQELEARLMHDDNLLLKAARSRHVHLAMPLSARLAQHILPKLRAREATTSLDVGHHVGWLQDEASVDVLRAIDYTMPNEKEASILSGDPDQYLERCRSLGLQHAVVKLGRDGAVSLSNGTKHRVRPPTVSVTDTTGAGDAFDAGFIDALLDGVGPREVLERACICGAMSTRAAGALGALPNRPEIRAILEEHYAA
ncbi:carbohydrate kinase family protein [Terriglobus roseus]|uniref:Sugar or nucleoside kinase, ribokinase family n=1 Tax=Terriglobus roseus TaxID=392734 RepID=A0A1H4JAN4_9BACT|nr:carbohydrate kinase family protein [Terriglobus roseus]SEB43217.1 Sugar or nucleoside kinase, ribokinase family [Terriglobus roseus]